MTNPLSMIHFTNQLGPFIKQPITTDQMTMTMSFTKNTSPIDEDGFQTVHKHKRYKVCTRSLLSKPYFVKGSYQNMEK